MTHQEVLNLLLSKACPNEFSEETQIGTYIIELHCNEFWITAKSLGDGKFEVISYKDINCQNDYRF